MFLKGPSFGLFSTFFCFLVRTHKSYNGFLETSLFFGMNNGDQEIERWVNVIFVLVALFAGLILGYSAYDSCLLTSTDPPANWA
jgi:uncharacterized membrane protein